LFCKQEFVHLDKLGRCKVWFGSDGLLRREPLYPAESVESKKQPFPKNLDTSEENKNETENAVSAENSEKREDN
jgi:hypothetical protein